MSRRIEVELTSTREDGTWTWRAAGAKQPKGELDGGLLYRDAKVGDVVRADADFLIDGIVVTAVLPPARCAQGAGADRDPGLATQGRSAGDHHPRPEGARRSTVIAATVVIAATDPLATAAIDAPAATATGHPGATAHAVRAATAPIVPPAPTNDGPGRPARRRRPSRSPSASAPGEPIEPPCWRRSPKSSVRWPNRCSGAASPRCVRRSRSRTRPTRPRASPRSAPLPWWPSPSNWCRRCAPQNGTTRPMPPWPTWPSSICATCAPSSWRPTPPPATRRPASSPSGCAPPSRSASRQSRRPGSWRSRRCSTKVGPCGPCV